MSEIVMLNVAILDPDATTGQALHDMVNKFKGVSKLEGMTIRVTPPPVKTVKAATSVFKSGSATCLFIDIYSLGAKEGIEFYQYVRDQHPLAPICRYATQSNLAQQPGVLEEWIDRDGDSWRERLGYVYQLPKHLEDKAFAEGVEDVLIHFRDWIEGHKQNQRPRSDPTIPVIRINRSDAETVAPGHVLGARVGEPLAISDPIVEVRVNGEKKEGRLSAFLETHYDVFIGLEKEDVFINHRWYPNFYKKTALYGFLRVLVENAPRVSEKDAARIMDEDVRKRESGHRELPHLPPQEQWKRINDEDLGTKQEVAKVFRPARLGYELIPNSNVCIILGIKRAN